MSDFDHGAIDELLSSRVRIAMVAFLAGAGEAEFAAIRDATKTTDGNAGVHLRKLEDAGYVSTQKNGAGVTARTSIALSRTGRAALDRYTTVLRQLLDSAYEDAELQLGEGRLQYGQGSVDAAEGRGVDRAL